MKCEQASVQLDHKNHFEETMIIRLNDFKVSWTSGLKTHKMMKFYDDDSLKTIGQVSGWHDFQPSTC